MENIIGVQRLQKWQTNQINLEILKEKKNVNLEIQGAKKKN